VSIRGVGRVEVCCAEEDESNPDHGEERAEGEGRFEGAEPEEEGEDEPGENLFTLLVLVVGCEAGMLDTNVERKRRVKVECRSTVGFFDLEAAWDQDDSKTDPKSTI
jgi:hypothetical protein